MKTLVKGLLFLLFLGLSNVLQAQIDKSSNGVQIEMTPYDVQIEMTPYDMKADVEDVYDDLIDARVPKEIHCRIAQCPTKLKAVGVNIFMVETDDSPSAIKVSKKLLNRIKKKGLIGVHEDGKVILYKKGKGKLEKRKKRRQRKDKSM